MAKDYCVQCRVSAETKRRLGALAAQLEVTESALLNRLVDQQLLGTVAPVSRLGAEAVEPRDARIMVRLKADDRLVLRERAIARGMPEATDVSAQVRAYLRSLTPLPAADHRALKTTLNELTAVGRNLN